MVIWHWTWLFKVKFWKCCIRNGRADWHGTKGMWVDRMLHPLCDFQRSPHPWPWPWILKVKFWKSRISGMGWPIDMELKGCESILLDPCCDFQCPLRPWPWPWIFKVKFWKCCISGMGEPIDMEWKECEAIGWYTHFVTFNFDLNHDFDLGFLRSNFEKVISQKWDGRLTWNQRDVSRWNVGPMLWLSTFPSPMTLTLDFQCQILKKSHIYEKIYGHRELTVSSRWPRWSRLGGPMITARRGHSWVTARSQLSHD